MGVVRCVLVIVIGSHTRDVVVKETASVGVVIRIRGIVVTMTGRGRGSRC